MERTIKWIIALGGTLFFLRLWSYVIPEFACLVLSAIVLAALVVLVTIALIAGFTKWRKHSRLWMVPSLVGLAFLLCSFYVASPMGQYVSDRMFEKHLGDYSRVVSNFKEGNLLCAGSCKGDIQLIESTNRPAHVRDIWGTHCDDGGVVVLFRADTDVPLLHQGYIFKDYEERSNCGELFGSRKVVWSHLPYIRPITGHWYRFSDQPGF
jgi:hypothetical protein